MSNTGNNPDPLSDWTVMGTRGEEVVDVDSESSDSSIEVVSIEGREAVSFRCYLDEISDIRLEPDKVEEGNESALNEAFPLAAQMVERDGGLGACCMELVLMSAGEKDMDEQRRPPEEAPISVNGEDSNILTLKSDTCAGDKSHESDEESDFVCLDANNTEEAGGDRDNSNEFHPMVVMMERSTSSIGPSFNFFRQEEPVRHHDEDLSDRDSVADLDDDTESSVEDAVDDRIESEQSEVDSVQAQNDVGDLSAFADIGDLPLEVGNVARNYIHRPNNRLSTFLNTTVLLAAILTMGISLGIIMAGDLEIEEWERAYDGQVKKTLEMESLLAKAELKFQGFEDILTAYSVAEMAGEPVAAFITDVKGIVSNYRTCREANKYLHTHDCKSTIHADILTSIFDLERTLQSKKASSIENQMKKADEVVANDQKKSPLKSPALYEERMEKGDGSSHKVNPISEIPEHDITNLQQFLTREQGRALYWQQLYLYERRQRKRERENEELEDQRDRILWEKADEEEDRRLREQWEREEEEEDRLDRLRWEQEEAEEDRKDRERWEREKSQITFDECFRVISANLTGLAQNVLKWNTSRLHDFANLSMLMSSVAELKQSVVQSVKQLRKSTEIVSSQEEEYHESNNKEMGESHFDQTSVTKYLQGALKGIKSEVDNILIAEGDDDKESKLGDEFQVEDETKYVDSGDNKEKDHSRWHKAFKSLFKMTSRSLKRFGREIAQTWKNVKSALKGKKTYYHDGGNRAQSMTFPPHLIKNVCKSVYIPDQMPTDVKKMDSVVVDIGCQCAQNVRHTWYKAVLDKPCQVLGIYSYACNIDHTTLKREIKDLQKSLGKLMKRDNVKLSVIPALSYKGRRKRLEELQDFWDTWGDHELLMRIDRDWARCRLKWWSDVLSGGDYPRDASCRSVNLSSLLDGLVEKDARRTTLEKSMDVTYSEKDAQQIVNNVKKAEILSATTKTYNVFEPSEPSVRVSGENTDSSLKYDDDDSFSDRNYGEDDDDEEEEEEEDGNKERDFQEDERKVHKVSTAFIDQLFGFGDIEETKKGDAANDTYSPLVDDQEKYEDDEHEYTEKNWLLERAQHRLQLRREKEKAAWLFGRASEREKLRDHGTEISLDWNLLKGKLRAALRRKEHEADWVFDRAKQRREKFKEKWIKERKGNSHHWQDRRHSASAEEFSHESSKRHKKQKHEHEKGQKRWKKVKPDKKHKHNSFKKQHSKCGQGEKRYHKKEGKQSILKRFVRQMASTFFSP